MIAMSPNSRMDYSRRWYATLDWVPPVLPSRGDGFVRSSVEDAAEEG